MSALRASQTPTRTPAVLSLGAGVLLIAALAVTVPTASNWWQVIVLGIVEGLTEFLPISSTGHLLVAADLLHFQNNIGGTFEIFIQLGAIIAVFGYYARDLLAQAQAVPRDKSVQRFWLGVFVAFLPAAGIGLLLHKWIKQVLFDPNVIAVSLIGGGIILILIETIPTRRPNTTALSQVSLRQSIGIGIAQVLALVPGVSRSGASIVGAMLSDIDRRTATAFSFYLAIPTLGAATIFDLLSSLKDIAPGDFGRLFLGLVVSMIVAWLSIGWLLRYVANNSFVSFGIYRILAGIGILALLFAGRL